MELQIMATQMEMCGHASTGIWKACSVHCPCYHIPCFFSAVYPRLFVLHFLLNRHNAQIENTQPKQIELIQQINHEHSSRRTHALSIVCGSLTFLNLIYKFVGVLLHCLQFDYLLSSIRKLQI